MKGCVALYRSLFLFITCVLVGACLSCSLRSTKDRSPRSPHEQQSFPAASRFERASPADRPSTTVDLAFELLRAELPVDSIRHSQKVWNHIDELRVDPALSARLAQNGLHIGAASADSWPAIRAILNACGARAKREQLATQTGLPLVVELDSIESTESIFSYAPNGRLVGKTFPGGRKLVNVGYSVHPELGGYVDLKITLEVRRELGVMTWERRGGIIRQVPAVDRYIYENLTTVVSLNPGEFLVIGPGRQADNEYLVGARFFTRKPGDRRYEVLLMITPLPYRVRNAESRGGWEYGDE